MSSVTELSEQCALSVTYQVLHTAYALSASWFLECRALCLMYRVCVCACGMICIWVVQHVSQVV